MTNEHLKTATSFDLMMTPKVCPSLHIIKAVFSFVVVLRPATAGEGMSWEVHCPIHTSCDSELQNRQALPAIFVLWCPSLELHPKVGQTAGQSNFQTTLAEWQSFYSRRRERERERAWRGSEARKCVWNAIWDRKASKVSIKIYLKTMFCQYSKYRV